LIRVVSRGKFIFEQFQLTPCITVITEVIAVVEMW